MDNLSEIIQTFGLEDRKEFKIFLQRHKSKTSRKDEELFQLLVENANPDRKDLLSKLYSDENLEAYHATRKRLLKQLIEYISLRKTRMLSVQEGYIESLLSISNYLFYNNKEKAAWSFLKQAEELATNSQNYQILNNIYSLQIDRANTEFATDLLAIIAKKKIVQHLALEDDRANIANHLIRFQLNRSLSDGSEIDIDKIIRRVLQEYDLVETVTQRPKLIYNIISITRTAVLATKDFYSFEPYIIDKYQEIEKKGSFNKYNHYYKVNLIYMIAHVLYRNKKFEQAEKYLGELYANLLEYNKSQFLQMYPRYNLLLAAVYNYSGRNELAITLLERLLADKKIRLDKAQLLNTYLNLSIYFFQKGDYNRSVRTFQNVQHSDQWLIKVMGMEWVLKKNIIECINQFELGNNDIVDLRIRSIERLFQEYFKRPTYQRVKTFLNLVKKINEDPAVATSKDFYELVEKSFEYIGSDKEDIQAMTFYGWIKAKMQKRKYYDVLLELVQLNG